MICDGTTLSVRLSDLTGIGASLEVPELIRNSDATPVAIATVGTGIAHQNAVMTWLALSDDDSAEMAAGFMARLLRRRAGIALV